MTTLHIINKSPERFVQCNTLLELTAAKDEILLIENGVYFIANNAMFSQLCSRCCCYAIAPDLRARGLHNTPANDYNKIDYTGFVRLVAQHKLTLSW